MANQARGACHGVPTRLRSCRDLLVPHRPSPPASPPAAARRAAWAGRGSARGRDKLATIASVSAESRLHPRFDVDARADLIGEEVVLSHPIADISLGGCRFAEAAWETAGTVVQIVLTFPTLGANLPLTGRVVRATDHDMGLRFENLSDEQKWALRKHIRDVQRDKS